MANVNDVKFDQASLADRSRKVEAERLAINRMIKRGCFHRDENHHPRQLVPVSEFDDDQLRRITGGNVVYSDTTLICTGKDGCRTIFESAPYGDADLKGILFAVSSIFEQVKWVAGSPEQFPGGVKGLDDVSIMMDVLNDLFQVYAKMTNDRINRNNDRKREGRGDKIGGIGLPNIYSAGTNRSYN